MKLKTMNYEKKHKQYISEWKSVNDNVKLLAQQLCNVMWKYKKTKGVFDPVSKLYCVKGEFVFDLSEYFEEPIVEFGMESINVVYKITFFRDAEEYNAKYSFIGNSEFDVDTNTLFLRVGSVDGYFNYTTTQEVFHELEHVFQYGMGMEKRKSLYQGVQDLIEIYKGKDEFICSTLILIYMTFPHEQDAFANQFYGLMTSELLRGTFEELVNGFPHYVEFERYYSLYKRFRNTRKNDLTKVLSKLGMSYEQFNKRVYFGRKRLINKLHRVYQRHIYELKKYTSDIHESAKRELGLKMLFNEYKKIYPNIEIEKIDKYYW